jgi:hypothetical protein
LQESSHRHMNKIKEKGEQRTLMFPCSVIECDI